MWKLRHVLRNDDDASGGVAAPVAPPVAATPPAAPAPGPAAPAPPAPTPPAPAPSATPAAAPVAKGALATPVPPAPPPPDEIKANWPENWRELSAKGDDKLLKRFGRYASPEAAMEALVQAQNRISAGELKPVLKKNATAEEVTAWRAEAGIPETPDKYDLGREVTEAQKPTVDILLKHAHQANQTPEQVKATLAAWDEMQRTVAEMRVANDDAQHKVYEDELRAEWGPEFRRNWNVIDNMLNTVAAPGLKQMILEARAPDGSKLGSNPAVLRTLLGIALVQNPAGVVVPGSEANPMQGINDEKAKIEKMMRDDRAGYNKDEKIQARYRELIEAEMKLTGKG